jgi:hypothetical protein
MTNMNYEYAYQNNQSFHNHDYTIPPLLQLIDCHIETLTEKNKRLQILDLGCGNGSLSNF